MSIGHHLNRIPNWRERRRVAAAGIEAIQLRHPGDGPSGDQELVDFAPNDLSGLDAPSGEEPDVGVNVSYFVAPEQFNTLTYEKTRRPHEQRVRVSDLSAHKVRQPASGIRDNASTLEYRHGHVVTVTSSQE